MCKSRSVRLSSSSRVLALGFLIVGLLAGTPAWAQTVAGGASHTVILKSDGTVWTVGANSSGQLGDGTTTFKPTPIQVSGLSGVVKVAAGANHTMAITSTGALYVWGANGNGQVGDASTTTRTSPVQSNLTNVVAIAAGEFHSAALTSNGNVYTWGGNANGQLGDGSTTQATAPVLVVTGASAIGAGLKHTLFVKTDGTVYATGLNGNGQLGDASTTQRTSPVQMSGVTGATAAVGGEAHSTILLSNGTLKATGYNFYGQLGDSTNTQRTSAVAVSTVTNMTAIASGRSHTLARESDGTVWSWGMGNDGQIGDGGTAARNAPYEITSVSSIADIGAGHYHSMAVTSAGVVYTWGDNAQYQLGDGTNLDRKTPVAICEAGYDWKVSTPILSIPAGTYNTDRFVVISITTTGATIRYTRNGAEPTESDATATSGGTVMVTYSQTLKAKAFKSGVPASTTATATYEMRVSDLFFSPGGTTYTSPRSVTMAGQVTPDVTIYYTTDGSTPTASSTLYTGAVTVATTTELKAIGFKTNWTTSNVWSATYTMNFGTLAAPVADQATGTYTNSVTVALSSVSGATIRYTVNGTTPNTNSPIYTAPLAFDLTTTLKAKAYHPDYTASPELSRTYTLVVASPTFNPTGGTYTAGQLITVTAPSVGSSMTYTINGVEPTQSDPGIASGGTLVAGNYTLKAKAWKTGATASTVTVAAYAVTGDVTAPAIAAGDNHSLAIRHDGVSWAWGMNGGQLGDGTTVSPRLLPRIVSGLTGAVAVAGGGSHSLEVLNDGTAVAFGYNANGQLGDGTTTTRTSPVPLTTLTGMTALAGGADHSLGLKGDGSVLAWGLNTFGQVGDGTTTQRLSPTAISSLSSVASIAAGVQYSLALKQNGTVWAWGRNLFGQLGDGTTTTRTAPVQVTGISTATAIAAGLVHSLAVLADGTVQAWGDNSVGSLGDGTLVNQSAPIAVAGMTDVMAVAAGDVGFSIALTSDGTVWSWGNNGYGSLGDGTTTNRSSAAQISGLSDIVKIAAGSGHVLALADDGTVYAWGLNSSGQLGDGTTTNRLTPVALSGVDMNWRVPTPILSLNSGQYFSNQSVTVTVADPDATLRYTTTGVDPTSSDATVTSGGSISVDVSQTLKVSGWKTGALTSIVVERAYELKAVAPTMSPGAGAYGSSQSVAVSTTTSGATLRYTLDGTEPGTSSAAYSSALTIAETLTLKARAYNTGWTPSNSGHASFSISGGTVATPIVTPTGGTYTSAPLIGMSTTTSGATLRYTLDGSTPNAASPIFTHPFLIPVSTTIKVKAFKSGFTASATTSVTYDLDASSASATPSIVPAGGRYATAQTVTITGTSGATLRYTTDGTDPTTSSTTITSGGTLTVSKSQVLKVRAWATGLSMSAVRRADFLITGAVAAGKMYSLALTSDGTVWAWGSNNLGRLGDGSGSNQSTPVQVLTNAVSIAGGYGHSLAAKSDGTLWAWGWGVEGQIGPGGSSFTPRQVALFSNAVAVAAGTRHSLTLKSDGTVWAFGFNGDGQIGDGTTVMRTSPVQVLGLTGISAIAAGNDASYALQTDGAGGGVVWAWGANGFGQLGDGSTVSRSTPTQVIGLTNAVQIASSAGAQSALALAADGRVFSWGNNDDGQLGTGFTAPESVAREVLPLASVRLVAAGDSHGIAVDSAASSWTWGRNTQGQLGLGDSDTADAPVPGRSNLGGALAAAAGDAHTLAIMPSGAVHAFGDNTWGALGSGGSTSANPVAVSGLSLADNTWLLGDQDLDGLHTWREYLLGTDPLNADSNGNGILDGLDDASGVSATNPDLDGDGVSSWIEQAAGTDPFRADTDGDGFNDGADAFPLDPTRWLLPSSNPSDTTPPVVTLKAPVSARPIP